jgi:hypothetical protein
VRARLRRMPEYAPQIGTARWSPLRVARGASHETAFAVAVDDRRPLRDTERREIGVSEFHMTAA